MHALHDDHLGSLGRVVQAGGHRLIPPLEGGDAFAIAVAMGDVVRIIDDDAIAPFAGGGPADAGGDAAAGAIVVKAGLGILIGGEREAITPMALVPKTVNQPAAF